MKTFASILSAIAALVAIILFVNWLNNHIDERVTQQTSSDEFINKLSENIKPYVLFNQNGTILYDGGAMKYIDSIKLDTTGSGTDVFVMKVTIKPKQFMKIVPFLECIDYPEHTFRSKRGNGFDIIYNLINANVAGLDEIRFRLEILK